MRHPNRSLKLLAGAVLGGLMLALAAAAQADPPSRVGRLSYVSGAVSFSPAGEDDWVVAGLNRPTIAGDRLWADSDGIAELQLGNVTLRLAARSSVTTLNLDDRTAQFQVAQGTVDVSVRRLAQGEVVEIDTPNLAFSVRQPGRYRIDVDPNGGATSVAVRAGAGDVFGEGIAYSLAAGQWYRFYGTRLERSEAGPLPPPDSFDRWTEARERRYGRSATARYVSPDMIGYEDLDDYGDWRPSPEYGNVWVPRGVPVDWAPYRYGRWAWVEPWGWTWIDDAPWGFAPFHYGRWALVGGGWGWVPGPVAVRPVYAPALVAFIGSGNVRLSLSVGGVGVGWFPLGPGEVYRPAYRVSENYFTRVNVSNTTINNTYVTNVYHNRTNVTEIRYAHRQAPAAVTAVSAGAFAQSQHVGREHRAVSREALAAAPVGEAAPVAPSRESVHGGARAAANRPSSEVLRRPTMARAEPPPPPAPFAARQSALAANPGRPLAEGERPTVRAKPQDAPRVTVVKPATAPQPVPRGAATPEKAPPATERRETRPPEPATRPREERAQPKAEPAPRPPETRSEEPRRAPARPPETRRQEAAPAAPAPRPPEAGKPEPRRAPAEAQRDEQRAAPPPAARPPQQEQRAAPPRLTPQPEQRAAPPPAPRQAPPAREEPQRAAPPGGPPAASEGKPPERGGDRRKREDEEKKPKEKKKEE